MKNAMRSNLSQQGRGYHAIGEHKKSLFFLEKALSLKREAGDQSMYYSITKSINGIAVAHLGMKNYGESIIYFNKSLDLVQQGGRAMPCADEALLGCVIPTVNMMAANASFAELGKVKEAYREVSLIFPSLYGVGVLHPHMASALTRLATTYKNEKSYSEASSSQHYQPAPVAWRDFSCSGKRVWCCESLRRRPRPSSSHPSL